jgi:hypothetical protein
VRGSFRYSVGRLLARTMQSYLDTDVLVAAFRSDAGASRQVQALLILPVGRPGSSRWHRPHITNGDLANAANVTPFTASRLISQWQLAASR